MTETPCRICFEVEPSASLLTPCDCRGSQEFVHLECLQSWQTAVISNSQLSQASALRLAHSCAVCKANFRLSRARSYWWRFRGLIRLRVLVLLVKLILLVVISPFLFYLALVFLSGCKTFAAFPHTPILHPLYTYPTPPHPMLILRPSLIHIIKSLVEKLRQMRRKVKKTC
jgi:hypothetical protein